MAFHYGAVSHILYYLHILYFITITINYFILFITIILYYNNFEIEKSISITIHIL